MKEEKLVLKPEEEIQNNVDMFSQQLGHYLEYLNLPTSNVLVNITERKKAIFLMPTVITERLNSQQTERAFYISKFIASCTVGLFDAALNFLWNETILNLREKIVRFDLDYFLDSTLSGSERVKFTKEEDLEKIEDWKLIRGCRDAGIISNIGFKHLDFIRDMRNFASAAHPNQIELRGLQLVDWLETCIVEVLAKEPTGPVLDLKRLLFSIRTEKLDIRSILPIEINVKKLPIDLVHSLLRAIFGMYTDEKLSQDIRKNIQLIANCIWEFSDEDERYGIGLKYANFSVNAEVKRKKYASRFLTIVDGLGYLTEDHKILEINEKSENLSDAHYDFNNFSNEEPHAKILLRYIPKTGKIPDIVRYTYVKTVIICRLGNSWGISNAALPYYNKMIGMFQDPEMLSFLELLKDNDILTILRDSERLKHFYEVADELYLKTKDDVIKRGLKKLLSSSQRDIESKKTFNELKELLSK